MKKIKRWIVSRFNGFHPEKWMWFLRNLSFHKSLNSNLLNFVFSNMFYYFGTSPYYVTASEIICPPHPPTPGHMVLHSHSPSSVAAKVCVLNPLLNLVSSLLPTVVCCGWAAQGFHCFCCRLQSFIFRFLLFPPVRWRICIPKQSV